MEHNILSSNNSSRNQCNSITTIMEKRLEGEVLMLHNEDEDIIMEILMTKASIMVMAEGEGISRILTSRTLHISTQI